MIEILAFQQKMFTLPHNGMESDIVNQSNIFKTKNHNEWLYIDIICNLIYVRGLDLQVENPNQY